jgi:predicted CXXCH cytochrome family protein
VTAHGAHFPIGTGQTHAGLAGGDCLLCHAASQATPKAFAADFTQYDCYACHVQTSAGFHDDPTVLMSNHVGVTPPFQPTSAACFGCHPSGAGAPTFHPLLFPIDTASKHAGIACDACHAPNRADVVNMKCVSCHADPTKSPNFPTQHPPVGSVQILVQIEPPTCTTTVSLGTLTNQDCLNCHALSQVTLVSTHPGGDTAFGTGRHQSAGCYTCHVTTKQITATGTPPPTGYPTIDFTQPNPASQSSTGCAKCHSNGCGG